MANRLVELQQGQLRDGRIDVVLADSIDIGLLYWEIFGMEAAHAYLILCGVPAAVLARILSGPRRQWGPMP
ncbi:MAG: hypothetical protein V4484_02475 [Pseudomonadota bacterium]